MKILFECHDCDTELVIVDNIQGLTPEDVKHCPICGSENIITSEK